MGGVGPRTFLQMLMRFGSPEDFFDIGAEDLEGIPRMSEGRAERILKSLERIDECEQRLHDYLEMGIEISTYLDDDYPGILRVIDDPPPILYFRGNRAALERKYVALVGTTEATQTGIRLAVDLSREFVKRGFGIISGLALGIDSAAHLGALKNEGSTVAVLGCGALSVYPEENDILADNIARHGLLLSEYQPFRSVRAAQLVLRNRLISGLASAVVVVQVGNRRRGELRTAHYANKQAKPLFFADPEHTLEAETLGDYNGLLAYGVDSVDDVIKYMV
jgi:DNA processing protein